MEITTLGSGSAGNAILVKEEKEVILVDAGFSGVELTRRIEDVGIPTSEIMAMLISHEHEDHIQGARVFAKRNGNSPTYTNSLTVERLRVLKKSPEKVLIFSSELGYLCAFAARPVE